MVALINTSFKPAAKPAPPSFVNAVHKLPQPAPQEMKIREKQVEMKKLLEPVSSPPLVTFRAKNLKVPPPEYRLTTLNPNILQKLATQPNFNVNITLPSVNIAAGTSGTSGTGNSTSGQSGKGVKKFGVAGGLETATDSCTIAFILDADGVSVTELQWIGCQNAAISNDAEKALYKWVKDAPKSYRVLNPNAGDTIEFTFERR